MGSADALNGSGGSGGSGGPGGRCHAARGPTRRRALQAGGAAAATLALPWLAGCERAAPEVAAGDWSGGWIGANAERGHRLRGAGSAASAAASAPLSVAPARDVAVLVVGAGVAGLAAARTLVDAGVDDVHVLELEDAPGGNARGHAMGGMRCPLGAHYLPLPGPHAHEVHALLDALGIRQRDAAGRIVYDEAMLCHAPQERLHIAGGWRDGLLPPVEALPHAEQDATAAAYRRFAEKLDATVAALGGHRAPAFAMPTERAPWTPAHAALDAITFAAWLDREDLRAPALRWYLDYCCRDDYGAGLGGVSAWAGLHYFASRHGFHAPGASRPAGGNADDDPDGVLTWPEGNGWLTARMAATLAGRIHPGRIALHVDDAARGSVEVDVLDAARGGHGVRERWRARQVVLAVPLFIAARLVANPRPALVEIARLQPHAPWLVGNLQLGAPLQDVPGAPPAWDNVVYGSAALGYVDAMHQSMRPYAGATVLTHYWALGDDAATSRRALLQDDWRSWARRIVNDLAVVHPDLPEKLVRVDLMRYGHAMAVPSPGLRGHPALAALARPQGAQGRVHHAHADLAGYSVFEEALFHGVRAGRDAARALTR